MSNSTPTFPKLNNHNYKSWSGDIQAWLMSKELWMLVSDDEPCPDDADKESQLKWKKRAQKAAGELFLSVEQDQKSHFHGCYSTNLLVSVSSWHLRSPATVSLLTYDSPYLRLCYRSTDRTAFFSHTSHVCIVYKTDIDWVVPQSIRRYYYGFPFTREGSGCTLSCFFERRSHSF